MESVVPVHNENFSGDGKEFTQICSSRLKSRKSFERAIRWNLANLVKIYHRTSTPHRSETNGIAERAVRRITEGTSAVLLQSGLDEKWRADSV